MNDRILILGKGFIGERLQEELKCSISGERILSFRDAEKEIKKYNPGVLINCIGYVGEKNVDGCELNKDKTLFANTFVPVILAEVALRNKIKLIHVSSGCIYRFDESDNLPREETEIPDFLDLFYSRTKIYTERALEVLSWQFDILIVRIRIPLDNRPHRRNLLTKLIGYKKISDKPNSVTYIPDFIEALKHLIKIEARGIYNIVNRGGLLYSKLLDIYKKYDSGFDYKSVSFKELNLVRSNLILSADKLEKTGFKMRHIDEVLEECVRSYVSGNK